VTSETISDGASWGVTQNFTYDPLNRLYYAAEPAVGGGQGWTRGFGSTSEGMAGDRWGNIWVDLGRTSGIGHGSATPTGLGNITAKNRLSDLIADYDRAGNQTKIGPYETVTYDAESRAKVMGPGLSYDYDGDGRRVKKVNGSLTTQYVYDAFGQLAAEYTVGTPPAGTPAPSCTTCYLTADHLGSTRVVTDAQGVVKERHDFLPFGEEILADVNGRTTAQGYPSASSTLNVDMLFTGQIRDAETANAALTTGLDYFGARYYSGAQGRFTTPDEFTGGIVDPFTGQQVGQPGPLPYADITDPQTLNKYAYVRNNPLRYVDPDGHCPWCIGALIGGVGGATASLISQTWSHPDQDINWKQVGAAALGGAVAGGTLGIATAPGALITVLGGDTVMETGAVVGIGAAAGSGVLGGITERAVASGGDPNAAIGTLGQIATDAAVGAVVQAGSTALVNPVMKASTTAGRAVSVGEARIARGTKPSPGLPQRQGQLSTQQKVASGALGAGVDAANRAAQQKTKKKEEEQR
jgi:RHS repeat-associated protein